MPDIDRPSVGVAAALVVLAASVVPAGGPPTTGPLGAVGRDLWLHAFGWAGLTAAFIVADGSPRAVLRAAAAALAVGAAVELLQDPLPWRTASLTDLAADVVGVAALAVGWVLLVRFRRSRRRRPGRR